jgi:cytochrome c oxidase cbb3-type subunit II
MNSLPKLFLGIFAVFAFAWFGLVVLPYKQLGGLTPEVNEEEGTVRPATRPGIAEYGAGVYAANGCMYCHSQQIRPEYEGSDLQRGWGTRRTVARDYVNDKPIFLGTMRTGPDLTNVGARIKNAEWHHQHLYSPQAVTKGSIMPPYRYLYEERKITGSPSPNAVKVPGHEPKEGYEIVPTHDAEALVAYLLSLDHTYPLKEAPVE